MAKRAGVACCGKGGGAHTQRSIPQNMPGWAGPQRRGRALSLGTACELSGCTMLGPKLLLILICTNLVFRVSRCLSG